MTILEQIADKEYLGRVILLGRTRKGKDIVAYAVTGRSESSQARILVQDEKFGMVGIGSIKTQPTDPEAIKKGNPALLIYNCIRHFHDSFIVSNGAQTDLIYDTSTTFPASTPIEILTRAFSKSHLVPGNEKNSWIDLSMYEPDAPNWTPRISGVLRRNRAALSIVRWCDGEPERNYFEFPLQNGRARVLATYTGQNVPKGFTIPIFKGEPWKIFIHGETPQKIAENLYETLGPKQGENYISPGADFRVGVAALTIERTPYPKIETCIMNRKDMEGKTS